MDTKECRRCGFVEGVTRPARADAPHGARDGLCGTCSCAEDLREWVEGEPERGFVPPEGFQVVWMPEATQEFLSVMGRVKTVIGEIASTRVDMPDADVAIVETCRLGVVRMSMLLRGRVVGRELLEVGGTDRGGVARLSKGLRVVEFGSNVPFHEGLVAGTLAGMTAANIASTGAYRG